jgi:hypothetical protein
MLEVDYSGFSGDLDVDEFKVQKISKVSRFITQGSLVNFGKFSRGFAAKACWSDNNSRFIGETF